MKLKNGKIGNINKKLLAGALALTFAATSLTACSEESGKFDYSVNEQGVYEVAGTIDYQKFKYCSFLVIKNSSYDILEYYITYKKK